MENESDTQGDTQGVPQDVTQGDTQGDDLDKWIEYQVAVYPKITEYKNSMDDDFAFEEEKGEQKGGPKTSKVDQKGGPETREAILQLISENASITSREMANRLNINRSAISKHLKRMQDDNMIRREGSQKSGRWIIIQKKKCIHPIRFHCYIVTLLRLGFRIAPP